MSDPTPETNGQPPKPRKRRSRLLMIGGALALLGVGAFAGSHVHGHPGGGFGFHKGHHGWHHKAHFGGRWFGRGPMTEERAQRRAQRMAMRLSRLVDATPEQAERFKSIARDLVSDVYPLRKEMKSARQQAVDILTSDVVDRTKLEDIRATQMANADTATQRFTKALADAAEVMTAEQRAVLNKRIATMREMRDWWRGRD